MKLQFNERITLNRFGFHMLDASYVEKVVLVIVGYETLHLRWIHASVRLGHIDDGNAEIGEHISRHFCDGKHGTQRYSKYHC